eukprot:SAG31_NODE_1239_length_9169_cov_18.922492_20_plen_71_part_00
MEAPPQLTQLHHINQEAVNDSFFDVLEAYLRVCGCDRLPVKQPMLQPIVSGRGDGALTFPKYTSIAAFVR